MMWAFLLVAFQNASFVSELWPGEGIPQFVARTASLQVYLQPSRAAPRQRFDAKKGAPIAFDDTRYITLQPGRVVARNGGKTSGRVFGPIAHLSKTLYYSASVPTRDFTFTRGDTLEYLQYRAEGNCLMRFKGDVVEAESCPALDSNVVVTLSQPEVDWWIHIPIAKGGHAWLLVDSTTVAQLERRF